MTVLNKFYTGAPEDSRDNWEVINWPKVEKLIKRLQMRIAKAIRDGKHGKAKSLQWILSHSFAAKLMAVKRVTQNRGKKTPGVDGEIWSTNRRKWLAALQIKRHGYKPQPLRRVYIDKKNGKKRKLGIPTMFDRAQQALYLLGLEPISETLADKNAYGFRPKRSTADAIEQCFTALCKKCSSQWVLEGDIKACFDEISHQWMIDNIPMDKMILNLWLKAGFIDKGKRYDTDSGVPQGGIISPTLMLLTLKGLEAAAKSAAPRRASKVNTIAYADDFVITGASKEILTEKVKPAIEAFLAERGLILSVEKTQITNIQDGFDFLGFNLRKYKQKLLIKPTKANVLSHIKKLKATIRKGQAMKSDILIIRLNSQLRGWANYYRSSVASATFKYVDQKVFEEMWRMLKRRHTNKPKGWLIKNYYQITKGNTWTFRAKYRNKSKEQKIAYLLGIYSIKIRRHTKIKSEANPYNPAYKDYFIKRGRKLDKIGHAPIQKPSAEL